MARRPTVNRPDHPLAPPSGYVRVARMVLYEKLGPGPHPCRWCGDDLEWAVASAAGLTADHLDGDTENNDPANLVPACRGCNANRSTHGRRRPKTCEYCGATFLKKGRGSHHSTARFCSLSCARRAQPPRPRTAKHGTRSRYCGPEKCRCDACRAANAAYTRELDAKRIAATGKRR